MNILFYCTFSNKNKWLTVIKRKFKGNKIFTVNDNINYSKIDIAIVWNVPNEILSKLINVKLIFSLGAGVDHILKLESYNKTPIIRIKDPNMQIRMFNHVLSQILNYQLKLHTYQKAQQKRLWIDEIETLLNNEIKVGVLGLGYIGNFVALNLQKLNYQVAGYKKTLPISKKTYQVMSGKHIDKFIGESDIIVSILPSTIETNNFINKNFLKKMKKNSLLINIGRGNSLNEQDLEKQLLLNKNFYASLDVFKKEPLYKNNKLWKYPNLNITPHIAAITDIESGIEYMHQRFLKYKKWGKIKSDVNIKNGY